MNPFRTSKKTQDFKGQHPYLTEANAGVCLQNTYDYSPFGVSLDGRTIEGDFYRRGFNGMEKDDEVKNSEGTSYDFGARMYDPRVGRFLSSDHFMRISVNKSLYSFAGNSPIYSIDKNGEYQFPAGSNYETKYPKLTAYLKNDIQDILSNPKVLEAFMKYGQFTKEQAAEVLKWREGPTIKIVQTNNYGFFNASVDPDVINVSEDLIKKLESALSNEDAEAVLFVTGVTILHETVHLGDNKDGVDYDATNVDENGEEGNAFEKTAYGKVINSSNASDYLAKAKNKANCVNPNLQRTDKIVFDSNTVRVGKNCLIVKDLITNKDFGVTRNRDGSYKHYEGGVK
jgi:RHS repeat-associated protein